MWLTNRLPDKWKRNRDQIIDIDDEETSIQVTVTRAKDYDGVKHQPKPRNAEDSDDEIDEEWQDEVNTSIEMSRRAPEGETKKYKNKSPEDIKRKKNPSSQESSLDEWPDDWEDDDL